MSPLCPSWPSVEALQAGALPQDEAAAARTHLGSCLSCRRELEADRALATNLRSLGEPPDVDPEAFVAKLAPEIDRAVARRGRLAGRTIAAVAAVAVAAGLAFFLLLLRGPDVVAPVAAPPAIVVAGTSEAVTLGRTLETAAAPLV